VAVHAPDPRIADIVAAALTEARVPSGKAKNLDRQKISEAIKPMVTPPPDPDPFQPLLDFGYRDVRKRGMRPTSRFFVHSDPESGHRYWEFRRIDYGTNSAKLRLPNRDYRYPKINQQVGNIPALVAYVLRTENRRAAINPKKVELTTHVMWSGLMMRLESMGYKIAHGGHMNRVIRATKYKSDNDDGVRVWTMIVLKLYVNNDGKYICTVNAVVDDVINNYYDARIVSSDALKLIRYILPIAKAFSSVDEWRRASRNFEGKTVDADRLRRIIRINLDK
jgi:hypothetical protein